MSVITEKEKEMAKLLIKPDSQDCEKWERLFTKYNKKLYYWAYNQLHNQHDAEDVLQNTFIKVSQNLDHIDEEDERKTFNYLITILNNEIKDHIKHESKKPFDTDEIDDMIPAVLGNDQSEVERTVITKAELHDVYRYAMSMDEKYGRPFLMRYFNGVSIQELSEIMGESPRKLSLWISRAKKKIIDYIQREEDKNE